MLSMSLSSSLGLMSGANFPPIIAWNVPATSGFLILSRSNLSLDWVGFLVFFRRTRKVIITRPRGYKIEWSSVCSSFERFALNFMLNIENVNVLKSFITSGLCSDSGIALCLRMFSKSFITSVPGHGHFLCLLQESSLSYGH